MKKLLVESGMSIPYWEEDSYLIEKSQLIAQLQGVKIVEFVQARGKKKIQMLEAKTSAPAPKSPDDYNVYISEIREKFQNSISIINAAKLKRRESVFNELPPSLQNVEYGEVIYYLFLVIKEMKEDWIINLSDDLRRQLHPFLKCWNIPDSNFVVLNEDMARGKGIVE